MTPNAKPFASLSSGLLASKGHARPAMRSQGFGGFGGVNQGLDDLGWNDMGQNDALPLDTPSIAPTRVDLPRAEPARSPEPVRSPEPTNNHVVEAALPVPPVLVEREALKATIEAPSVERSVSVPTATRLRKETEHQAKAAFTLRVDATRHLKLRLASALTNRSAQDLVTQALDALIDSVPEVATLVAQLPKATPGRTR
ncbi:hypothetical protein [Sphingomonas oligophenolica]|uniref:Uncharacterized protein n=1 Tax=Sphingomonas oligophenolica TaxID=301154 RepID=A0A502CHI0_9SPHN|nr:hypothetical protein [Sphingomonas oligophenolica]TPG12647.1 hypothetical protein EAH84_07620 [Sphingomonas oligophenolica]